MKKPSVIAEGFFNFIPMIPEIEKLLHIFLTCTGASIDNRTVQSGEMFFGLPGEKANGGQFAAAALAQGAAFCVVDDAAYAVSDSCIVVQDVLSTMQKLALAYRNTFKFPVLALTGSNGKTTTKELIAAVLAKKYVTYATKGNLNNHIGVPLTILNIKKDCTFAVIEMGANHQGEIAGYCNYAQPDFALITNIGKAHLEGFGGEAGVLKGKSELFRYVMQQEGVIFWNSHQQKLAELVLGYAHTVSYGYRDNDYVIGKLWPEYEKAVVTIDDEITIHSQLVGSYNADNIIAAACIGKYFDVPYADIQEAIEQYIPGNNRSEWREIGSNAFILDAYNANPSSMRVALENFTQLQAEKKIVIMGDMLELGDYAQQEHAEMLKLALAGNFTQVVTVGPLFKHIGATGVLCFDNSDQVKVWFDQQQFSGAKILLKGSRGIRLEKIIQ